MKNKEQEDKQANYEAAMAEISDYIGESLSNMRHILDKGVEEGWSYDLLISDNDIVNAFFVFVDIVSHRAIKSGKINNENAISTMRQFIKSVEYTWGENIDLLIAKIGKRENIN